MTTDQGVTFGDLLRRFRTAAGLTQEELAERAGISRRAVSDLERGARTKPWHDTVTLLADALGLSAEERQALERAIFRTRTRVPLLRQPADLTALELIPLLGREREEAAIIYLLRRAGVRLLTLTGTAGVGKTRLALRVATNEGPAYRSAVHFVPLAPVRNPAHVASAIAGALALQEKRGQPLRQTLQDFLAHRHILLLLDNFEHLLDAASFVGELLASCPQLTVLITSREPLHLHAEQEFSVGPLATPPAINGRLSAHDLSRYPASALFLARARAVHPGIHLDDREAAAVGEICRKLDGLPLAIELAAAQLKFQSPNELLVRLQRRFEVLVGGPRDALAHQQTMRDCVAWSYDLLDPAEQDALCRIAVFAGGCTRDAAEKVIRSGDTPRDDIVGTVHSLADKSLLVADWSDREETRFTMLETIHEYALERLAERGQSRQAYSAYARYYLQLAEAAASAAWGPEEAVLLRRLTAEQNNLRAVLTWALEHDGELALRMGGALLRFFNLDGHYSDWRAFTEQALASGSHAASAERVKALVAAGWMALQEGDTAAAVGRYREGLAMARGLGEPLLVVRGIPGLGFAELSRGEVESAAGLFQEGLDVCQALGVTWMLGPMVYGLGLISQAQGDRDRARERMEEAVRLFRDHGECLSIGSAERALGDIALAQRDFHGARAWFEEGLQTALWAKHRDGIAIALQGIAASLAALGELEPAARLWGAAEAVHEEAHGPSRNGEILFARIPQLSPRLSAISVHFGEPGWQAAQAEGHEVPLEEIIASLRRT